MTENHVAQLAFHNEGFLKFVTELEMRKACIQFWTSWAHAHGRRVWAYLFWKFVLFQFLSWWASKMLSVVCSILDSWRRTDSHTPNCQNSLSYSSGSSRGYLPNVYFCWSIEGRRGDVGLEEDLQVVRLWAVSVLEAFLSHPIKQLVVLGCTFHFCNFS